MRYNWEFDDSVDFAPPHYRKSKYQKVEQLSMFASKRCN